MDTKRKLISIDPGKRKIAWAAWVDSELVGCGLIRGPDETTTSNVGFLARTMAEQLPSGANEVVMEGMVVQTGRTKDPRDILALQVIGGFVSGFLRPEVFALTDGTSWKNNRPKAVQHKLDLVKLYPMEVRALNRDLEAVIPSLRHDVLDAVGIGLWYLRKRRPLIGGGNGYGESHKRQNPKHAKR